MTKAAEQLLEQVLTLNPTDRADLVDQIMITLEPSTDQLYVDEWSREIAKRIEEHDSGKTKAIPWEEVKKRVFGTESLQEKSNA